MTCKIEITVVDTVALVLTLKLVRGSSDKTKNKERQSICIVKSINIPLQENGLVFIKITWVDSYTVNDGFCWKAHFTCVITVSRYDLEDHKNQMKPPPIFSVRV